MYQYIYIIKKLNFKKTGSDLNTHKTHIEGSAALALANFVGYWTMANPRFFQASLYSILLFQQILLVLNLKK